jgi:hypothetical protein
MYAYKLDAEITQDHRISIDLPADFPLGGAEIIVLAKASMPTACPDKDLNDFFTWLDTQPPSGRSKEEIDAEIAAERAAWGD